MTAQAPDQPRPRGVVGGKTDIKLGYSCNNRCVHCVISDQRDAAMAARGSSDRSTREFVGELTDARARGHTDVVFTGGEPTIRRDLPVLLAVARELGFRLHVQTNGRLFVRDALVQRMAGFDAQYVVALNGPDAAIHDAITQAPGSFEQTIQGIENLIGAGQRVLVKVVLSRMNAGSTRAIVGRLVELGVPLVNIAFPHAIGEAGRQFERVVPRYRDVVPGLLETLEAYAQQIDIGLEAVPFCLLPGFEDHVTDVPARDADCAIEHRQLDADRRDWQDARAEMKQKPASCTPCLYFVRCEGVWGEYLERFWGEELVPTPKT